MRAASASVALLGVCLAAGCACDAPTGERDAGREADVLDAALPDAGLAQPDTSPPQDSSSGGPDAPRLGPPYPIVLAHGFFGFEDFAGIDFIQYFWEVRADLAAHGEPRVYTPAVDPFNDSETRGLELLAHVEDILDETGHARVNLIAHSQGGLDARVVASLRPELVASVTTLATPHGGTPMADVILRLVDDARFQDLADALVRLIAAPLWDAVGDETSVFAPLRLFSQPGIMAFDAAHPDREGVLYFSIAGRTDRALAASLCRVADRPEFLRRYDDVTDPVDVLLSVPEAIIDGGAFDPVPNDGLVPVESSRHGRFLGCVPADHLDEIGQLLGDSPGALTDFDHLRFYRELVAWLRTQGL